MVPLHRFFLEDSSVQLQHSAVESLLHILGDKSGHKLQNYNEKPEQHGHTEVFKLKYNTMKNGLTQVLHTSAPEDLSEDPSLPQTEHWCWLYKQLSHRNCCVLCKRKHKKKLTEKKERKKHL